MVETSKQQYETIKEIEKVNNEKEELEIALTDNEIDINEYNLRTKISDKYNNYVSFEYSNYENQDIIKKYYINLQDTSLYNYFITEDSGSYVKVILDIILKITLVLILMAIVYYGFKILDGQFISDDGLFSNKLTAIKESIIGFYGNKQLFNLDPKKLKTINIMDDIKDAIIKYGCYIDKFKQPYIRKGSSIIFLIGLFIFVSIFIT
jgi:uncharacterized protein YeeX (DUF496 family)